MRRSIFRRSKNKQARKSTDEDFNIKLAKDLNKNLDTLRKMLDEPDDLAIREFTIGERKHPCAVAYIEGLVNEVMIQEHIIDSLQTQSETDMQTENEPMKILDILYEEFISVSNVSKGNTLDDLTIDLLSGSTIFYIDGIDTALMMDTMGGEFRAIDEPSSETLIRGPRVGFIENIGTNVSLIRHELRDPNLRFKTHKIGRRAKKSLVLAYIDGIIHPDILAEVNRRLKTIDIDNPHGTGSVEEWIEDSFLTPFPLFWSTERPDKVTASLLQGKFAVLVDGTPFALVAPVTLGDVLQSPEDNYQQWTIGSLLRTLRYFGAFIALFLPSIYIALVSFHPGMIPSLLTFSIAASREGVPVPAFVEAILMVVTMELLQEAGARLPQTIGQTVGIVGGLVIGEAAVQAGIVSPIMVIVVALTAIATFAVPSYSVAISFRILRFGFIVASAFLGLFGIILVYIMVNIHIVNLKSFGIPYSTPFAPFFKEDWKDLVIRTPFTTITKRPAYMETVDKKRASKGEQK